MKYALSRAPLAVSGALAAFAVPLTAFAAISKLSELGTLIINTINDVLVPVLFALAFIVFLWGAFMAFIVGAQNDDTKTKGKNLMLWGLIGFFVMISIWGLVNILVGTIDFSNKTGPTGGTPKAGVNVGK